MSRFLFVVPPLAGHVNPTVAVGAELAARGHRVAWCGHADAVARLLPPDAELFAAGDALSLTSIAGRSDGLRGAEAFRFLWKDVIVPLGDAMIPSVERAVDRFAPDVLVADLQAIAGALVARRRGLRWATSATTSSELADPFAIFPLFGEFVDAELRAFRHRAGLADLDVPRDDFRFSEELVLAFSTPALAGGGPYPGAWRFVGPAFGARPAGTAFPWRWLDPQRRHVLITLGTVNAQSGARFLSACVAAAARFERVQAIVVAPDGALDPVPAENVLVRSHVPQLALLPSIDAVVCHGGHNTVCESLAHGLPLVVAPIRDDQPIIAQQVVDARAGVRVKYGRAGPGEIAAAIEAVLEDDSYRNAAQRIAASFRAAGGPRAAAGALETLVADPAAAIVS
jgi:UDP:flavonoid glycosyltransferase YjiC (YdhE family)